MLREIFDNLTLHCGKHSHYFDVYERHLARFIDKSPVVVEVGICRGGSAEMWKKYFGEGATIIGIDVDDNAFKPEHQTEGCIQIRGDQTDPKFWEEFFLTYPEVDIFIDDGGHHMSQQINTIVSAYNHVKDGGVYICEDTHTSYWKEYLGGLRHNAGTFMEYSKKLIDTLNSAHYRPEDFSQDERLFVDHFDKILSMHYYDSIVVLEKGSRPASTLVTSTPI